MSTGKQPPIMMTASYFEVNHHYMQNKADRAAHAITNDKSIKVKCQRQSSALFDAQVGVKGTVFWDEFSTVSVLKAHKPITSRKHESSGSYASPTLLALP